MTTISRSFHGVIFVLGQACKYGDAIQHKDFKAGKVSMHTVNYDCRPKNGQQRVPADQRRKRCQE